MYAQSGWKWPPVNYDCNFLFYFPGSRSRIDFKLNNLSSVYIHHHVDSRLSSGCLERMIAASTMYVLGLWFVPANFSENPRKMFDPKRQPNL